VPNQPEQRHPDLPLVRAALAGDARAGEQLIQRLGCVPHILHAKNAQVGGPFGADELRDLTQDTLEIVWRKLSSYEGRSSLETWVYAYCQHQLMNAVRTKRRRQAPFRQVDVEVLLDPRASDLEREHDFEELRRGLDALDPRQADVIRLKHFDQLTLEQIAARLDMPVNTVKTHYYRGLSKLRERLEERLREEYA
jgi:RNA polymerase sigma-70 factor (ECF subfamily)